MAQEQQQLINENILESQKISTENDDQLIKQPPLSEPTEETEVSPIDKEVNNFIREFNEWNTTIGKDFSQIDIFVKKIKEMIDEIKHKQEGLLYIPIINFIIK
ncbi:hypothetical protein CL6EHI_011910 [Entamoeba histolytica]|uniref:Uncharacterized protein n=1 Tax=Entamoeba histolytica TaxID=5759 RepID=A0A175JEF6_ENTHI|nr:hypothetical protein CL6EHI_011910 [Entamoeba histolytica]